MLHNRLEHLWTWFGLNRLGAVYMGINTAYKGRFLTHVLANGGARWGVMEREFLPWLAAVEDTVPTLQTVFVPGPALQPQDIPAFQLTITHIDCLNVWPHANPRPATSSHAGHATRSVRQASRPSDD